MGDVESNDDCIAPVDDIKSLVSLEYMVDPFELKIYLQNNICKILIS